MEGFIAIKPNSHYALGDFDDTQYYFNKSLRIHRKIGNKRALAYTLLDIGYIVINNNADSALILGNEALMLAKETSGIEEIASAYGLLYSAYKKLEDLSNALKMHELFTIAENRLDSARGEQKVLNIIHKDLVLKELSKSKLRHGVELEKQEVIHIKEKYLLIGSALLLLTIVILYTIWRGGLYVHEKSRLLDQINALKDKKMISKIGVSEEIEHRKISKDSLMKQFGIKLNATDLAIIEELYKNPLISNLQLAEKVSRSLEGVSSSLRKMYSDFNIQEKSNKKLALIKEVLRYLDLMKNAEKD